MVVRVNKYHGGFYDCYIEETIDIPEELLFYDLVVWVSDSVRFTSCAYINLNFATNKQELKLLRDICYELRLNYIYCNSKVKSKFLKKN